MPLSSSHIPLLSSEGGKARIDLPAVLHVHQAGDLAAAEAGYREVLAADPANIDALHLFGLLCLQQGRTDEAVEALREAASQDPLNPRLQKSLGDAFLAGGHHGRAGEVYRRVLSLQPGAVDVMIGLAQALAGERRYTEAAAWFTRALESEPASLAGCLGLADVLRETRQFEAAERCYRLAIRLDPSGRAPRTGMGELRLAQGRPEEAVEWFERSLAAAPGEASVLNSLGNALQESGRREEAMETYRRALCLAPEEAAVHFNMAKIHADQEEYEAAIQAYERATRLKPDYCEAHANKALLQLLLGDLRHGWTEYEWRFRISDAAQPVDARTFDRPVWDGARFPGKTLLLRSEQGAGDMIQFCRYAPLVKERGGRVILECPPKLCRLLHDVPGVDAVVERRPVPSADFDLYIPLLSVPRLFSPSPGEIPAPVPYLAAEAELVRRTGALVRPGLLHVGLCWQGNPQYKGDARRSIPLAALLPVLQVPGVQCYSLQKGAGSEQMRSLPAGCAPIDLGGVLDNGEDAFCETAAVMQHLDLIISSDTAVPHLAGALGRPVWLLLAQTPEWRWFLQREDSPWYPTMRLFRQQTPGDWQSVVDRVVRELRHCGRPGEGGK